MLLSVFVIWSQTTNHKQRNKIFVWNVSIHKKSINSSLKCNFLCRAWNALIVSDIWQTWSSKRCRWLRKMQFLINATKFLTYFYYIFDIFLTLFDKRLRHFLKYSDIYLKSYFHLSIENAIMESYHGLLKRITTLI